jgi:hypothetical protein
VLLFLSFAADDSEDAREIAEWLSLQPGVRICSRRGDTGVDDPLVTGTAERKIAQADAFLVVMSPGLLASASCRRDRVVALHREPAGPGDRSPAFIQVIEVRPTRLQTADALSPSHWVTMGTGRNRETAFRELHSRLTAVVAATSARRHGAQHEPPSFHNRDAELEELLDELSSPTGSHFWRLIAAPQLGKSWFLDQVDIRLAGREPDRWTVQLVDLREKPPEICNDVGAILGMLFGSAAPVVTDQNGLQQLARAVIKAEKPHLCLLDSAELLDDQTSDKLRSCLSQIREQVERARKTGVWLALIVASRGEGWDGSTYAPRLKFRGLSEFTADIVAKALSAMRDRMGYDPLPGNELQQYSEHVCQLSQGLPALLYRYLDWIHEQSWVGLDQLLEERQFYVLTQPYIEELLSPGSLFGPGAALTDELRLCAQEALRVLVPYRLYTRAHLSQYLDPGGDLHHLAEAMGWDARKLARALASTDLNTRPQEELWEVIYAPVRRLLCRYWYPSDASLADAHLVAGQFIRTRSDAVSGDDRAAYFVECLWHKSQLLILNRAANAQEEFRRFTRELSTALLDSSSYDSDELRGYAAKRMGKDEELREAARRIRIPYEELTSIVGGSQR